MMAVLVIGGEVVEFVGDFDFLREGKAQKEWQLC
jgi:hypothetical protein